MASTNPARTAPERDIFMRVISICQGGCLYSITLADGVHAAFDGGGDLVDGAVAGLLGDGVEACCLLNGAEGILQLGIGAVAGAGGQQGEAPARIRSNWVWASLAAAASVCDWIRLSICWSVL